MSENLKRKGKDEGEDDDSVSITVRVWSRRPICGPRATAIDRLTAMRSGEKIGSVEINTWPDEVVLTGDEQSVVSTVEKMEQWAERNGVSLRPPLETRTVSPLIGDSYEVLTLPMLMVAVYDDGLAGVYPCTDGDRTWTVSDYLDVCETMGGPIGHSEDGPVSLSNS